jgi:hypothetical protein
MVCETKTCKVPYCTQRVVPYTVTRKVARCVPRQEAYTVCRMVPRCVAKQVPYEVCRIVPVQQCCPSPCSFGGCPTGACDGQSTAPYEAGRPANSNEPGPTEAPAEPKEESGPAVQPVPGATDA